MVLTTGATHSLHLEYFEKPHDPDGSGQHGHIYRHAEISRQQYVSFLFFPPPFCCPAALIEETPVLSHIFPCRHALFQKERP